MQIFINKTRRLRPGEIQGEARCGQPQYIDGIHGMDENAQGKYVYKTEIHKGTQGRALRISYINDLKEAEEKPPEKMEEKQEYTSWLQGSNKWSKTSNARN